MPADVGVGVLCVRVFPHPRQQRPLCRFRDVATVVCESP